MMWQEDVTEGQSVTPGRPNRARLPVAVQLHVACVNGSPVGHRGGTHS
jgi:hypothetical protein